MAFSAKNDPIERAVRQFMQEQGIDPNRVSWYRVTKTHNDLAVLELKMFMSDQPELKG